MTEQNNDENLANIQMNLNSNWWNYIVPANADVISAVNMTLLLPCLTNWVKQASNSGSFHEKITGLRSRKN